MLWIQRRTIAASFPGSIFGAFKIKRLRIQRRGPAVCRADCGEPAALQKRAAKAEGGQTSGTRERKRASKQETGRKTAACRLFVRLPPKDRPAKRKPSLKPGGRELCQKFWDGESFFNKGWSETQTFGGGGGIFYRKIRLFGWPKGQLSGGGKQIFSGAFCFAGGSFALLPKGGRAKKTRRFGPRRGPAFAKTGFRFHYV